MPITELAMSSPLSARLEVLDNGLKVLVREDHTAPVISCWATYRVGSRNERPGITGISHFVEHMLFRRTRKFADGDIDRLISSRGGHLNAFTSEDVTMYYETLPSGHLDLALEIEADRMVNAIFDEELVEAERRVILSEREMYENYPEYRLEELVKATALIAHPYRWPVIGWRSDIEAITPRDLEEHYRAYYSPANAVLAIAGDIRAEDALKMVRERLGAVESRGRPPEPRTREPPQRGERRVELRMPGKVNYVYIAYHAPQASSEDFAPFLVLDAVLAGAKSLSLFSKVSFVRSAKLYRELVRGELASSVGTEVKPSIDPFLYMVKITVRRGANPGEVERRALEVLEEFKVSEEEVKRAKKQVEAQLVYSLESATGQGLIMGFLEAVAGLERFNELLNEVRGVKPADVRRTASSYLVEDKRTVGVFYPRSG